MSDIVMSVNSGEQAYAPYRRDRDAEEKLLDRFRDPNDPLKILIKSTLIYIMGMADIIADQWFFPANFTLL